jgi:hypothetical protein
MKKAITAIFLCLMNALIFAQTDSVIHGKIPIDASRWYQLNNVSNGLQQLFDGDLFTRPNTGWGKILNNYDAYYPVPDGMDITIDSIKLFDWEGVMTTYPANFYAITDTSWQRIHIATFTGERYNAWDGPYPDRPDVYALDTSVKHVRYLVLNSWYEYPTEVEFYGSYKNVASPTPATKTYAPLKNFFGVNAFEWDFEDPTNPMVIDSVRMNAVKHFTGIRHYMDWQKLESNEGKYTFSPVHSGGWNYDTMYARCKTEGITVLACLKTLPDWMLASYPSDQQDGENVPVRYGKDFSDPNSYIEQARVAFQYAARYGNNKNVNTSLVTVDSSQRWTNDDINQVKIGLGLVKYIECDNERDKWWKGRKAYQTGREYAANLSAFYDGNLNTMGAGIGVKNADTSMQVVVGGLASANTDYIRGMIDWCKEFRGYKPNGDINFCWDIINYHLYANDARNNASAWPSTGIAPEISVNDSVANAFIQMAHQYAKDMPVWITETGYDVNQSSPQKAIPIGSKSAYETQADWTVRTSLLYARSGLQRCFFYEMYDDNPWSGGIYASSGLINDDKTPRPAANYFKQVAGLFGDYVYQQTLNSDPTIDRYSNGVQTMYALWIPDETGRTSTYNLSLNADTAIVYQLQAVSDSMLVQKIATNNGYLNITVTETPLFVMPQQPNDSVFAFNGFAATNNSSNLIWQVSSDTSNVYYAVERSSDNTSFTEIAKVTSIKSKEAISNYLANDANPDIGINYYRLRKVDVNNKIAYSKTIAINFSEPMHLNIYPNPAVQSITIDGLPANTISSFTLLNSDGKIMGQKSATGSSCNINVSSLSAGVYYVSVSSANKKAQLKFIKTNKQ